MQKIFSLVIPSAIKGEDYKFEEIVELQEFFEDGYKVVSITPNSPAGNSSYDCCFLIVLELNSKK